MLFSVNHEKNEHTGNENIYMFIYIYTYIYPWKYLSSKFLHNVHDFIVIFCIVFNNKNKYQVINYRLLSSAKGLQCGTY